MKAVTLKSGDKMPLLGLGTWQLKGEDCVNAVQEALDMGYRHIDTAKAYDNHEQVGKGIKKSEVDRDEIFITTKIWNDSHEYEQVLASGKQFLQELGIDYIDLLLIHWPVEEVPVEETLKGMQELKEDGIVKNIGVSNFSNEHLREAFAKSSAEICNNQIKIHPYEYPEKQIDFCQENDISVTAYSPLARGKVFEDGKLLSLSKKYNQSVAQLVLRWMVEKDIIVIPKATSREHIKDNFALFDWELPAEVTEVLDNIEQSIE